MSLRDSESGSVSIGISPIRMNFKKKFTLKNKKSVCPGKDTGRMVGHTPTVFKKKDLPCEKEIRKTREE